MQVAGTSIDLLARGTTSAVLASSGWTAPGLGTSGIASGPAERLGEDLLQDCQEASPVRRGIAPFFVAADFLERLGFDLARELLHVIYDDRQRKFLRKFARRGRSGDRSIVTAQHIDDRSQYR